MMPSTRYHSVSISCHSRDVVRLLLEAGASTSEENRSGHSPLHLAARYGHSDIIDEFAKFPGAGIDLRQVSRKTGMTPIHVAAFFGEAEATRELLTHVPAQVRSEQPVNHNVALAKVV